MEAMDVFYAAVILVQSTMLAFCAFWGLRLAALVKHQLRIIEDQQATLEAQNQIINKQQTTAYANMQPVDLDKLSPDMRQQLRQGLGEALRKLREMEN